MFKLRRRTVAATAASDQPFCGMCGMTARVDATTGRCALGHRVLSPGTIIPPVEAVVVDEPTVALEPVAAYDATMPFETMPVHEPVLPDYDAAVTAYVDEPAGGYAGEGLYEAYQSADAAGRTVTWEDVVAPPATDGGGIYEDYLTWDEPASGFSSLDVDTAELPIAQEPDAEDDAPVAPALHPISSDLLDELDDAAHARRRAVGTIGATLGASAIAFASIAVLPF